MTSGIYAIINETDNKRYIGRAVDVSRRWKHHQWMLNGNRHFNPHLQRAWNRGDTFRFSVIEKCRKEVLNEREIYWIATYHTTDLKYGYNLCAGGKATTGRKFSEETKKIMSEQRKGKKWDPEIVKKRVQTFKEKMQDPEYREQHHKKCSEAGKKRGSPWNTGKHLSEETKQKMSKSLRGKKKPKSQGEKLREINSGEKSKSAKLKTNDVIQIRLRFLYGERQCDICKDYPQITTQTLYDIVRNRRWKSIPNTIAELEEMERRYGT